MMAMLNVLILGNQQSEATTDVTDLTDIYACNPSTGARADRSEGIASLNPVGWVLTDRWAARMGALIPTVSSGKDMGKDEIGKGASVKIRKYLFRTCTAGSRGCRLFTGANNRK